MTGVTRSLWFGLLAAPSVWMLQLLLGWFFGARLCTAMSIDNVRATLAGVSALALVISIAAMWIGWRNAGRVCATGPLHSETRDRTEFLAVGGLLVSAGLTLGIAWASVSSIVLTTCGRVR